MRILDLLRNIIIILAISVLPFIAAEVILRLVYPDKVTEVTKAVPEDSAYRFDEDVLVSLKPNMTRTYIRSQDIGGEVIHWKTNSDSFRGPELMKNPKTRIIVYGDSNIQAEFSELENTFVYKLGEYLKEQGSTGVEVVNAGVVGFGPDQSLIKFQNEVDIYKPDLVIFNIFADNDFGDIIRNRIFELDANGNLVKTKYKSAVDECLTEKSHHDLRDFLSSLMIVKAAKKLVRSFGGVKTNKNLEVKKRLLSEKTLFILQDRNPVELDNISDEELRSITVEELQKLADEEYLIYKASKARHFSHCDDHYDIDIALDPDQESSKTKVRTMEAVLNKAKRLADSKGINFLVLIQPSVIDMTSENGDVLGYQYLQKYPGYKRTNLTGAVKDICVKNKIPYINIYDVFLQNKPSELFFWKYDNHWNDKGQDIAAGEVASFISKHMRSEYGVDE